MSPLTVFLSGVLALPPQAGRYAVLVDPGPGEQFLPAAQALADFHKASLQRFDPGDLDAAFAALKELAPDYVAFVLPPERIDVDSVRDILERSTALDDDPFSDFEYGFITGRDGPAALRFVERLRAAWGRQYGHKVALFGSWGGPVLPEAGPLSGLQAMGAEAEARFVLSNDREPRRRKAAREALAACQGKDALLFFSHGYPD